MKTWLEKFKTSIALDRGDKLLKTSGAAETRRFEEALRTMERDLRDVGSIGSSNDVPPKLHAGVMRALRTANAENVSGREMFFWRRLSVAAFVLAIGVGVFWSVLRPSGKVAGGLPASAIPPLFVAAIDQGHAFTQATPQAVLEPLSSEMELLGRDFQNAVSFLTDSMP